MIKRRHPYEGLPARAFWRSGVAAADPSALPALHRAKWPIRAADRIATAGSCFAQHFGTCLRRRGIAVLDVEPAPPDLPPAAHARHGYGLFSARTGNIYTARQLRLLAEEAEGVRRPLEVAWERDGRFVDALRPAVEPDGFGSPDAVGVARAAHLTAVRRMFETLDVLVFTLGLTEAFADRRDGTVFPVAPGVLAGSFDPERHALLDQPVAEVVADLATVRESVVRLRGGRPFRTLLTVSPVPITATASGDHILVANARSKATLRAAAAETAAGDDGVDYFPACEIVTNPAARSAFHDASLRRVTPAGVAAVMDAFVAAYRAIPPPAELELPEADVDPACEDALAAAFGQ